MPLLCLQTSVQIDENKSTGLAKALSGIVAKTIGKPEAYVMVTIKEATVAMAGTTEPAAFVDVRSIGGLNKEVNVELSSKVCSLLQEELGIPGGRVYLNFTDVNRPNWGFDGGTFG